MKAFLFPGQVTDAVATAHALMDVPEVAGLLKLASALSDMSTSDLLRLAGRDLSRTDLLQPLVTSLALGVCQRLREVGIRPGVAVGHSMGEIAAWSAADGVSPEDAVRLSHERGRLMADEAVRHPGGMIALRGRSAGDIETALGIGGRQGCLWVAAHNAPDVWALSGDLKGIRAAAAAFPSIPMDGAGPWHTPLMEGARVAFRKSLSLLQSREPQARLISNRQGALVSDSALWPELLADQIVRPVAWVETVGTLDRLGVTDLVFVGPARSLRSFTLPMVRPDVRIHMTHTPRHLNQTLEALAS